MTSSQASEPFPVGGITVAWIGVCLLALIVNWPSIQAFTLPDTDDHLRLLQVRDWLGGQSWFDLTQYRLGPPAGGDMHWSRLPDLPIAGLVLLFSPLLGRESAELAAAIAVPLILMGAAMLATGWTAWRLLGRGGAVLAALLLATSPALLFQFAPMRIDHHGWQIALAALAIASLLFENKMRSGIAAGLAMALWLQISLEGLPYLALIGAVLAVPYIAGAEDGRRLGAYAATLASASALLFALTRPAASWSAIHCDAVSLPFLLPLAIFAAVFVAARLAGVGRSMRSRLLAVVVPGGAALGSLLALEPACLAGPFAGMDPLVRAYWYENVLEGMPIWRQPAPAAVSILWTPLVGLVGAWLAWRSADADDRRHWVIVGAMAVGALLVALTVRRAEAVAHLYALPGCAFLLLALLRRVRPMRSVLVRVPLTAGIFLLPSPTLALMGASRLEAGPPPATRVAAETGSGCATRAALAELAKLAPSRTLATLDIAPALLAFTPHSAVAAGYHRNQAAIRDVIAAFRGSPEQARAIVQARGIDLIVYCRGQAEVAAYRSGAPSGLMSALEKGRPPNWLEPALGRTGMLTVWRVRPGS